MQQSIQCSFMTGALTDLPSVEVTIVIIVTIVTIVIILIIVIIVEHSLVLGDLEFDLRF